MQECVTMHVRACTTLPKLQKERYYCILIKYLMHCVRSECLGTIKLVRSRLTVGQLAGDLELSVKNGAELLDRLVKDIVSESASSYVSVLHLPEDLAAVDSDSAKAALNSDLPTAFSLPRFIPLLQEKIGAFNPFVRTFLVSWLTLLDSIPDLELVTYLPSFLGGLLKFLSDENQDVHNATQTALERFLGEIKKIARIKRGIAESRKSQTEYGIKHSSSSVKSERTGRSVGTEKSTKSMPENLEEKLRGDSEAAESMSDLDDESATNDEKVYSVDGDWVPGQDVDIDHPQILDILVTFLSDSPGISHNLNSITDACMADLA